MWWRRSPAPRIFPGNSHESKRIVGGPGPPVTILSCPERRARALAGSAGFAADRLSISNPNSHFLTPRNLSNLILQITVVGTLGAGVVLALLLGEIDLSLGAVAGVAAAILGVLVAQHGWLGLPAIIVALAAGAIMGLLQGTIIVWARVPSFIATLAGLLAWHGVQLILLGSSGELLIRNPLVRSLASGYLTQVRVQRLR